MSDGYDQEQEIPTAAYELLKDADTAKGEAKFYYGYDPRHRLSGDIYKTVNPLVRRTDANQALKQERQRLLELIDQVEERMEKIAVDSDMEAMAETFADKLREEVEQE